MISESSLRRIGCVNNITMNTQSSSKTWIWIVAAVVIGGAVSFYFYGKSSTQDTSMIGVVPNGGMPVDESQVLSLLNQIRNLHIDTQLFEDPAYTKLYDYSVPIPEKNVGRPNPFAPLPGEATKSAKTTTPAAH